MALSGTLDTFELPDVLRLLASTAKTGRLRITGDRGSGSVWVDGGEIVGTELLDGVGDDLSDEEAVFGLLRFGTGSFTFEADAAAPSGASPRPVAPVLGAAEALLVEWRSIEAVVPSLAAWAVLSPELPSPDVTIVAERWRAIAVIGSGATVGAVGEALGLREMDACRTVKELIELGLAELADAPADAMTAAHYTAATATSIAEPAVQTITESDIAADHAPAEAMATAEVAPDATAEPVAPVDEFDSVAYVPAEHESTPALAALESSDEAIGDAEADSLLSHDDPPHDTAPVDDDAGMFAAPTADEVDAVDLDPAEMARQLANLSPKAAKAVAAAAKASTVAERDAALAAVEAEDDSVNRGLLLKFLGSVES